MDTLRPSSRYSIRLYVLITLVGILILGAGSLLAWIFSADWAHAVHINRVLQAFIFLVLLGYLLSLWFAHYYYLSITYELKPEEIKLQRGIWVQNIQHIPLRSIAGVTIRRDFFDRCLEIGTLEFLLVSSLNKKIVVVSFVGLSDVDAQYHKISDVLLHYWGTTMRQSELSNVDSPAVFANSAIDLR